MSVTRKPRLATALFRHYLREGIVTGAPRPTAVAPHTDHEILRPNTGAEPSHFKER